MARQEAEQQVSMIGIRLGMARAAIVAALYLAPTAALPQDNPLVENVFFQTDLRQALEDVSAQTGVNIIVEPSVQGVVTLTLDNQPLSSALGLMLTGTGYRMLERPDYIFVFDPDASADFFVDVADTVIVDLENIAAASARSLLPFPLQKYVRSDDTSQRLAITAPPDLLERISNDLRAIDRDAEKITTFVSLEFVLAQNARDLLPPNLRRFVSVDAARNVVGITAPENSRIEILSMLRRLDVPTTARATDAPAAHRTRLFKLDHARAENTVALLPESVAQYVKADPESNTLAVSAPRHLVDGIFADIAAIDIPRRHVMLDARVVVLERNDLLNFGTDFRWPQITAGSFVSDDVASPPWELRIGYTPSRQFTNALSVTLNFLSANNQATIVSSPQVMAQDGVTSEIKVITEEFFEILTNNGNDGRVGARLEQIETGTILSITPRVGRNGNLTLDMDLEVSDVIGRGENNLPVVSRRTAKSRVQIEDGGTAAVAGLVDTRSQVRRSGFPGSLTLPLLGRAFRADSLDHQARQVAIFITATLVAEGDQRFADGAKPAVRRRPVTDEQYRAELERALVLLGARN